MITIYQGTQDAINRKFITLKQTPGHYAYLYNHIDFPVGWSGLSMLVQYLKETFDEVAIDKVLTENSAIAAFIFPEMVDQLNQTERDHYNYYFARYESRLNVPYELYEATARLLDKLLAPFELTIVLPELKNIDSESLRVIENYYRFFPDTQQKIVFGFAIDIVDDEDDIGIIWHRSGGTTQYFTGSLMHYPSTQIIVLDEVITTNEQPILFWKNFHFSNEEHALFNRFEQSEKPNVSDTINLMETAYGRYSFSAVVKIGLKALQTYTQLSDSEKGSLHGLVGSAANFYQFSHHADPPFDDFLAYHFEEALKYEKRPEMRLALLYRITFTYAERREELEKASFWAEKMVTEAKENDLPAIQHDYHLAWAYNVRGHVYAHTDQFEKCKEDSEAGYVLFDKGITNMEKEGNTQWNVWLNDYKLSIFNLSIHQVYTGDEIGRPEYSIAWYARMDKIMALMPRIIYFDTFHWVDFHRNKLHLKDALAASEEGIADAIALKHGQIYVYLFCAGDLNYRIGEAANAASCFEKAESLRPIYNDLFQEFSMYWFIGNCYMKMGLLNEAQAVFEKELSGDISEEYKIRLWYNIALIAAMQGDKDVLEKKVNTAIDLAVNYGEQNLLLRITCLAGYAAHVVGDTENAQIAYQQAIELANSFADDGQELNSPYLLEMYVGNLVVNGYEESLVIKSLKVLPKALDDLESWWLLSKLSPFVDVFLKANPDWHQEDGELTNALKTYKVAVSQRNDCHVLEIPA